jgi:TrpR family trp operon transcriptional repressor
MSHAVHDIARIFAGSRDPRLIESFLKQILTPDEYAAIGSRWELVRQLHEGTPQREIAKRLGLSLCKITRGSRELKKRDGAFRRVLEAEEKRHG